jgi:hypothetical protein
MPKQSRTPEAGLPDAYAEAVATCVDAAPPLRPAQAQELRRLFAGSCSWSAASAKDTRLVKAM